MKNSKADMKVLKKIAIILSIILVILDISLIIVGLFEWGAFVWGILAILIIWLEYFLVKLFIYVYNKFKGLKKIILSVIIFFIIIPILILFMGIMALMFSILI